MTSFSALVFYAFLLVFIFVFKRYNRKKNLPPGPRGLPFLGNLLQLGPLPHLKLKEWVKVYGNIFQIKMGLNRVVVISDPKLIREAFNDPRMAGRMDLETFTAFTNGRHGIVNSEGDTWMEQRRFSMRTLRDLGFGKQSMEGLIMEEVHELMTFFKTTEGQRLSPGHRLEICILNVIWALLSSGNRVKHDDVKFMEMFHLQKMTMGTMAKTFTMFAPGVAKMIPNLSSWNSLLELRDSMHGIYHRHVKEHKENFQDRSSEPIDFIDAYLKEMKANDNNPNSSFYKEQGDKNLLAVMMDFFLAGPDTTSSTIAWSILYLSKFPHVQKKVQAELDLVIGKQREPTLADRVNLPYICATMEEVLRHSSIVPLGVFRQAMADVKFQGYDIPEGTWICQNNYYLHRSEEYWDHPDGFQPERHLLEDGKRLKPRHEAILPFGVGKRACVGESLARDAFFLFFVNIFQKYNIQLSLDSDETSLDAKPGFVLSPQDYNIVLTDRT